MQQEISMNKMGVKPIKRLMLTMGIPMILSMAVQAIYNIVDSYFVSCMNDTAEIINMGDLAVNALTLAFPVQMLMIAIGVGTGVGINSLLSKSIGEGKREKASKIAGNSVFLGICTYVVFLLFGIFLVRVYLQSQTQDILILNMSTSYLRICTVLSMGVIFFMIYEKLLQATGRTTLSTIAQITGALTNIVLDPILIFGYFGAPELGIDGAAYATVIGQFVSCLLCIIFHYKYNKDMDSDIKYLKPERQIIKEIYKVGVPAILMQALMSIMTYGVNVILVAVSTEAVTAYGLYYKIQQFIFFAAFGMNNAMIPIIGFNYGKKDLERVEEGIKYGIIYSCIIMLIGAIGFQIFAYEIVNIFAISDVTQGLFISAIRVITIGYLFVGANIAYQGIFQALGLGGHSLVISLLRLIIVALPVVWIFSRLGVSIELVWSAFPIAEAIALVVAVLLMKRVSKSRLKLNENSVV